MRPTRPDQALLRKEMHRMPKRLRGEMLGIVRATILLGIADANSLRLKCMELAAKRGCSDIVSILAEQDFAETGRHAHAEHGHMVRA